MIATMISCCSKYIETNCPRILASLAKAITSSFGMFPFIASSVPQIIHESFYGLQNIFIVSKRVYVRTATLGGLFQ